MRKRSAEPAILVWHHLDLRLGDNPALHQAAATGAPIIPVYIWSPGEEGNWQPGAASRWWLHHSLRALHHDFEAMGSRLTIREGPAANELRNLIGETEIRAVYWNRRYEPALRAREAEVEGILTSEGVETRSFNSALLFEPWEITTGKDTPYKVFTPFWNACLLRDSPRDPLPKPRQLQPPLTWPRSLNVEDLGLDPKARWTEGLREMWHPGEAAASQRVESFSEGSVEHYDVDRDMPYMDGTARLSPHLHFGEISPRQIWQRVESRGIGPGAAGHGGREAFLRQLAWREFAHHILFHNPNTADHPLREQFSRFPWRTDEEALLQWQQGCTGYPFVDAGMRELWATGFMHNRARLAVASFLVKHLLIPWQKGARWFWDTLVDADLANNTMGWQWTAGCGADAAPYFRIFNPVTQGKKFDPQGEYIRRWIPELAALPDSHINRPWEASPGMLREFGVELGGTYPEPIVDHAHARARALLAFEETKRQ